MKVGAARGANDYSQNKRISRGEFNSSMLTMSDIEIGRKAYRHLGVKHRDDGAFEIAQSEILSYQMVCLERILERLPREPWSDLFKNNNQNDGDFVELTPSERRFKEHFVGHLPGFVRVVRTLPSECKFSPAVEVFIECCRLNLVDSCIRSFGDFKLGDNKLFQQEREQLNKFYWELKESLCRPAVRKKIRDKKRQVETNFREYKAYVDRLFDNCARLVVIRLDLEYMADSKPCLSRALGDLDHFFSNHRHNELFRALDGYIAKVEFGVSCGFHFHLLLFFDGSKRSNHSDVDLAKKIGEYWKCVITKGKGRYRNVNKQKNDYAKSGRLGVGVIHAEDAVKRSNLRNIVRYFCKKEQFFKPVASPKSKLLRKGRSPLIRPKKMGRPRKVRMEEGLGGEE